MQLVLSCNLLHIANFPYIVSFFFNSFPVKLIIITHPKLQNLNTSTAEKEKKIDREKKENNVKIK